MRDPRPPQVLRHSFLDRLCQAGKGQTRAGDLRIGVSELKEAVKQDIEQLLSTRRPLLRELETLPEARTSILAYGLPDFSQFASSSASDRDSLCKQVVECLRTFEPRLAPRSLVVEPAGEGAPVRFHMSFRIRGELHVDPVRERVVYDTDIELGSGAVTIKAKD